MSTVAPRNDERVQERGCGLETASLMEQDSLLTQLSGGLLPAQIDVTTIQSMLDLGCGPGGWTLDAAFQHPEIQMLGIDSSSTLIRYAQAQASVRQLANADFACASLLKPLPLPDATFHLVHARLLQSALPKERWPGFVQECLRVLAPGGTLILTEAELCISNSPSFERFHELHAQALWRAGYGFSPDGRHAGITPMLLPLLRQAGFQNVQQQAQAIDFSGGTSQAVSLCQNLMMQTSLLSPFLVDMGVASSEELERLVQDMQIACYDSDFCALWYFLSAWGKKPDQT